MTQAVPNWRNNYPTGEQALKDIKTSNYGMPDAQVLPDIGGNYPSQVVPDVGDTPLSYKTFDPDADSTPYPTKAMSVVLSVTVPDGEEKNIFNWRFFDVAVGQKGGCTEQDATLIHNDDQSWTAGFDDKSLDYPPWPRGIYDLTVYKEEGCQFKCDGTSAGRLFCPSFVGKFSGDSVGCKEDPAKGAGPGATTKCPTDGEDYDHAVVICEW